MISLFLFLALQTCSVFAVPRTPDYSACLPDYPWDCVSWDTDCYALAKSAYEVEAAIVSSIFEDTCEALTLSHRKKILACNLDPTCIAEEQASFEASHAILVAGFNAAIASKQAAFAIVAEACCTHYPCELYLVSMSLDNRKCPYSVPETPDFSNCPPKPGECGFLDPDCYEDKKKNFESRMQGTVDIWCDARQELIDNYFDDIIACEIMHMGDPMSLNSCKREAYAKYNAEILSLEQRWTKIKAQITSDFRDAVREDCCTYYPCDQ